MSQHQTFPHLSAITNVMEDQQTADNVHYDVRHYAKWTMSKYHDGKSRPVILSQELDNHVTTKLLYYHQRMVLACL